MSSSKFPSNVSENGQFALHTWAAVSELHRQERCHPSPRSRSTSSGGPSLLQEARRVRPAEAWQQWPRCYWLRSPALPDFGVNLSILRHIHTWGCKLFFAPIKMIQWQVLLCYCISSKCCTFPKNMHFIQFFPWWVKIQLCERCLKMLTFFFFFFKLLAFCFLLR